MPRPADGCCSGLVAGVDAVGRHAGATRRIAVLSPALERLSAGRAVGHRSLASRRGVAGRRGRSDVAVGAVLAGAIEARIAGTGRQGADAGLAVQSAGAAALVSRGRAGGKGVPRCAADARVQGLAREPRAKQRIGALARGGVGVAFVLAARLAARDPLATETSSRGELTIEPVRAFRVGAADRLLGVSSRAGRAQRVAEEARRAAAAGVAGASSAESKAATNSYPANRVANRSPKIQQG